MTKTFKQVAWAIIFTLLSMDASASSCALTPVNELYEQSEFVFEAEVVKRIMIESESLDSFLGFTRDESACGPKIANLRIKKVWKGRLDQTPSIYSEDSCLLLGSNLAEGETYVIFARRAGNNQPFNLIATPGCGSIQLEKHSANYKMEIDKMVDQSKSKAP